MQLAQPLEHYMYNVRESNRGRDPGPPWRTPPPSSRSPGGSGTSSSASRARPPRGPRCRAPAREHARALTRARARARACVRVCVRVRVYVFGPLYINASTVLLLNHLTLNCNDPSRVLKKSIALWRHKGFYSNIPADVSNTPTLGYQKKLVLPRVTKFLAKYHRPGNLNMLFSFVFNDF